MPTQQVIGLLQQRWAGLCIKEACLCALVHPAVLFHALYVVLFQVALQAYPGMRHTLSKFDNHDGIIIVITWVAVSNRCM